MLWKINFKTIDERDQKARDKETLSFNYETGIYEATCRLRINTHRAGNGRLQQMYTNLKKKKTYWKDVEIGNFQD